MPAEYSSDQGYGVLLVPQPPQIRTIFYGDSYTNRKRLMFPHTLFVLFYFKTPQNYYHLKSLHVAFGQTPFTGEPTDKLFGLPLHNHNEAFATCLYQWGQAETADEFIKKIIGEYWMGPFIETNDWASYWSILYKRDAPEFLKEWTKATKENNLNFIMDTPLLQAEYMVDLGKLLNSKKSHFEKGGIEILSLSK